MRICVRLAQQQDFAEDIAALKNNKSVTKKIIKLSPFLGKFELIRVGGRLKNALISENAKHPMLLAKTSPLSKLICEHYHRTLLHAGPRTARAVIQRKLWIISIHSLLRKLIHKCLTCFRWRAKPTQPEMGNLPPSRVQVSRCFSSTTMDMAGPFLTKDTTKKRSPQHKSYFCVFVCEATKACHLEAVSDLSTASFLAAFNRYVARRSYPHLLRSDNGRNFIGARRQLKECQQFLEENSQEILTAIGTKGVKWKLNPAGGLHDAAVKSTEQLLYKIVGDTVLTFEEFSTLLARVEAVLNSRPIAFLTSDPNEGIDYLSPGHFLVGGPLVSVPEEPLDLNVSITNRWIRVQQITLKFWKRFQQEYLHTLMQREKRLRKVPNLKIGQLAYVIGEKHLPLSWPLGRIVGLYPSADGVVRVVDIKTSGGIYRRPINKLAILPGSSKN